MDDQLDRADALVAAAHKNYREATVDHYHKRTEETRRSYKATQAEYEAAHEHYLDVLMGAIE